MSGWQGWRDTIPWLSHKKGKIACFWCPRCGLTKKYPVDSILAATGDISTESLPGVVAQAVKCKRANDWRSDPCRMAFHSPAFADFPTLNSSIRPGMLPRGMYLLDISKLHQLDEWHELYSVCRCGRIRWTDKSALKRRFPDKETTMDDVGRKLKCKRCGNKQGNGFAYMMAKR